MKQEVCPLCNAVVEVNDGKYARHRPRWREAFQMKAATCFASGRTRREVAAQIMEFEAASSQS